MAHCIEVRKTYRYRLYRNDKRDKYLRQQIDVAGVIWNHALSLQKRYYRLTGNYIPPGKLKAHIANLRMQTRRFAFWQQLGSQAVQDICERLDTAYQRFFKKLAHRPPKYKQVRRYSSFTLKQSGWKVLGDNRLRLGKHVYKFVKHRPMSGVIKTVTIKRDAAHRLWLLFSVVEAMSVPEQAMPGKAAGFDFGLKTFLTDHTGKTYLSGLYHQHVLKRLRALQSRKDKKPHGTNNRRKAARLISRTHIRAADQRRDAHFKLAHELCDEYDVLCFEDLNMAGMKALWGRKVSDLAFYQFMSILKWVAFKRGKHVVQIGRFERTTGKCSRCGHTQNLELRQRIFECASCGFVLHRDHNAAINILYAGASAYTGLEVIRPASAGCLV